MVNKTNFGHKVIGKNRSKMSFTHKIVGKILGDIKSKNYGGKQCQICGKRKSDVTKRKDKLYVCSECLNKEESDETD